jgi:hypothetical protein
MNCFTKRGIKAERRFRRNTIHPETKKKISLSVGKDISSDDSSGRGVIERRCIKSPRRKERNRQRRNAIHQETESTEDSVEVKYIPSFMESFLRESMHCGKCRGMFSLSTNELKIHCNLCNEFFHCGIAGECVGEDCSITKPDGTKHRASYCIGCVDKMYSNGKCLCKDCAK